MKDTFYSSYTQMGEIKIAKELIDSSLRNFLDFKLENKSYKYDFGISNQKFNLEIQIADQKINKQLFSLITNIKKQTSDFLIETFNIQESFISIIIN